MKKIILRAIFLFGIGLFQSPAFAVDCDVKAETLLLNSTTFSCKCILQPKSIHLGDLIDIHWGKEYARDEEGNVYVEEMPTNGYSQNHWSHYNERQKACRSECTRERSWMRSHVQRTCNELMIDSGFETFADTGIYSGGGANNNNYSNSNDITPTGWTPGTYDPYEGHNSIDMEFGDIDVVNHLF